MNNLCGICTRDMGPMEIEGYETSEVKANSPEAKVLEIPDVPTVLQEYLAKNCAPDRMVCKSCMLELIQQYNNGGLH